MVGEAAATTGVAANDGEDVVEDDADDVETEAETETVAAAGDDSNSSDEVVSGQLQ
jgi:hypothetical protein